MLSTKLSVEARMVRSAGWFTATVLTILLSLPPAKADTEVDVALVLAVDISNSMDPEEQRLQREGFVEAFRTPAVHDAIRNGMLGRITVVYAEWAGTYVQHVVVPWTTIEAAEDALAFADKLASSPIQRGPRTSISGAIDLGMRLLTESRVEATRQVIDISGDGANNQGRAVTDARDEAIAKGITINGLPLLLKRPRGAWDIENLDDYYRDCVIGGPGAFMVPVRERQQFAEAIRIKIIREIAEPADRAPAVIPAQAQAAVNCRAGEYQSDPWFRN
jgi:hypothetical protein